MVICWTDYIPKICYSISEARKQEISGEFQARERIYPEISERDALNSLINKMKITYNFTESEYNKR